MRRAPIPALLLLFWASLCPAEPTRRVLLLRSFGPGFEPYSTLAAHFQTDLARRSPVPVEFFDVSMTPDAGLGGGRDDHLVAYLDSLGAERPLDLVVALGAPATRFVQPLRGRLMPETPLLIAGADRRSLDTTQLSGRDATVLMQLDIGAFLEAIVDLRPDTSTILVVTGNSPIERFWRREIQKDAAGLAGRVALTFCDGLPFDEIKARAAALPPRSAVFYGLMVIDARGVPYREDTALAELRAATAAPIFGVFEEQLGRGIVGGRLISVRDTAAHAVDVALALLRGEPAGSLRAPPVAAGAPLFDARELEAWGIGASRLPRGSTVLFRSPTLWSRYKWQLLAGILLCASQAVLIVALLVHRVRWRRAEAVVRDVGRRLVTAQEEERRRLARELHDDVTQRLARLAIDVGRLERDATGTPERDAMTEVREGIARVSEDVHALSYRLHPSVLEDLGLEEALRVECERFSNRTSVPAELAVGDLPEAVPDDVALCLFRVTQEALRNVERHARARSVEVELAGLAGGIRLRVRDDGVGLGASGERSRPGLGLAFMKERVRAASGTFAIDGRPGRGTTVEAFVPLPREAS